MAMIICTLGCSNAQQTSDAGTDSLIDRPTADSSFDTYQESRRDADNDGGAILDATDDSRPDAQMFGDGSRLDAADGSDSGQRSPCYSVFTGDCNSNATCQSGPPPRCVCNEGFDGDFQSCLPRQNWLERSPGASPSPRAGHAMVFTDTRTILFGGASPVRLADTWAWDGTNWNELATSSSPVARAQHAMAYDPTTNRTLLFGGVDSAGARLADTWTFDGSDWTLQSPVTSPGARDGHSMSFDPSTGEIVLFGGNNGGPLWDTWTWDGSRWHERTPQVITTANQPAARSGHALVYDQESGRVILLGGQSTSFLSDTWTWQDGSWTQLLSYFPGARRSFGASAGQVVVFGGVAAGGYDDTWSWLEVEHRWVERDPVLSPSHRSSSAMVFDSVRSEVVLFGGFTGSAVLNDTWVYR